MSGKWLRSLMLLLLCGGVAMLARGQGVLSVRRPDGRQARLAVYAPSGQACAPLAVLSPGSGDDRGGLTYLATALQRHGWRAVMLLHRERDPESLRDRLRNGRFRHDLFSLSTTPDDYRDRLDDVAAALAWARAQCRAPVAVLIGHAMGAVTAMLEAGAENRLGLQGRDRFDAYVPLSPEGRGPIFPADAWHHLSKPLLLLTGTLDDAPNGSWRVRTQAFADLPAGCHWLGVIDHATHMNLAGFGYGNGAIEKIIVPTVEAFVDGVRAHRCEALPNQPGLRLTRQ
ncbi:MAG: alpha/beta hydrolase [Burkholderiales bacterium]|nr:alpha/beta hydrolase [Burkholderiales bacterium]